MTNTRDAARGRWPSILAAAGFPPEVLRNQHGPCPLGCDGKRSWRFDDRDQGSWICSHCGAGDGFEALQRRLGLDFAAAAAWVDDYLGHHPDLPRSRTPEGPTSEQKRKWIRELLRGARPLKPGDPGWRYLESRCGPLEASQVVSLRHHPGIRYMPDLPEKYPALLALLQRPDGIGLTVHRYYLTDDGHKAPVMDFRKMMPIPDGELAGAAVRTSPVQERIGIAEGLETALCASKIWGIPVWSAISAPGLRAFEPPGGVQCVWVMGDHDASFTGQEAAFALARRLRSKGIEALVQLPERLGEDWADVYARSHGPQ